MSKEIKIGDTVKCINNGDIMSRPGNNPPLRVNGLYIVNDLQICKCGGKSIDVNLNTKILDSFTACTCGERIPGIGIHWCDINRFAKIDEATQSKEEKESDIIDNSEFVKELLTKQLHES